MNFETLSNLSDITLLQEGRPYDPHRFLGLHETLEGQVIRLWRPGAEIIRLEVSGGIVEATCVHPTGVFEYTPVTKIQQQEYRVFHPDGRLSHDPYSFIPTIGEIDSFLFNKGCHYKLYEVLGAKYKTFQGVLGTQFAVWAPNARSVSLLGDFNHWNGRMNPMRSMGRSGIWELFIPELQAGERYKFEIQTRDGFVRVKSDPYAFFSELRPKTASIVANLEAYCWTDREWMTQRVGQGGSRPLNIYEVHLGSWRNYGTEFPTYRQLAVDLAKYCKEMGFTHVELMPIMEHPLDESWGYQVTGFFSATSRYGTPADFQYFVDHLHNQGIGVILDWVPAHFPMDESSLSRFDGSALYEHEDPRKGLHPHWNTAIFNYGRKEVSNFLIASALFWFEKMHVDGLRVDAVASLLYLDYGRNPGEWIPNPDGSNFNIDAVEFLKHLNAVVRERFPGVLMIAEESSSYSGVTHPVPQNGLGFDLKWNMGWMNDTLRYFQRDPIYRKFHQNELTFSLLYAFSERFMCVLSHDEVVHEKGSLLNKMPGPDWQKFAGVRLLYSYFLCHPGKKLFFMGGEVGQWNEWNCKSQIDWYLLQYPLHQGLYEMIRELNHFYLQSPPFWESDFEWKGYEWIDFSDNERSVISYLRKSDHSYFACVHNFTPAVHTNYSVQLKGAKKIREVFNTDAARFGGSNLLNPSPLLRRGENGFSVGFTIALAPLATLIFEVEFV